MRDILFRGKTVNGGMWVCGDYTVSDSGKYHYITANRCVHRVEPDTVGQFTGERDRNGKRIFEGDICEDDRILGELEIVFEDGCFCAKRYIEEFEYYYYDAFYDTERQERYETERHLTIIGNIYENPDLRP